jgi:hypothetical protein
MYPDPAPASLPGPLGGRVPGTPMGTPLVAYLGLPGTPDPWSYTGYPMAATVSMGPPGFEPGTNGL